MTVVKAPERTRNSEASVSLRRRNLMSPATAASCALGLWLCGCERQSEKALQKQPADQTLPGPNTATPAPEIPDRTKEARLSVASFNKDMLTECLSVTARTVARASIDDQIVNGVSLEATALSLFDNAVEAFLGREGSQLLTEGPEKLANSTALLVNGIGPNGDPETVTNIRQLSAKAWPSDLVAELVRAGEMARVPNCSFPNKTPLAGCRIQIRANIDTASTAPDAIPWHFHRLELDIDRQLYDRALAIDTDAAMRTCLRLRGNWSIGSDTSRVTQSAARQPDRGAGDIDSLEVRAAQTQAAHMRAVAEHRRNANCQNHRECMEAIPSVRELPPGEYSRRMFACKAAKTSKCSEAEKVLEQARDENIATQAELQAARARR